jgi:endonuclease YncB( thermonuclease family)
MTDENREKRLLSLAAPRIVFVLVRRAHYGGVMLRHKRILPILALLCLFPFVASPKEPIRTEAGVVRHVADGDTVQVVTNEGTKLKIRLYGIDAPEIQHSNKRTGIVSKPGQPYGEEAYRALESKVLRKIVRVQIMDIDRYHRMVAIVYLGDCDVNREMVQEGYAWAYREYLKGPYASEYIDAENDARSRHLGLWQQMNPQPPWEFRRLMRMGR